MGAVSLDPPSFEKGKDRQVAPGTGVLLDGKLVGLAANRGSGSMSEFSSEALEGPPELFHSHFASDDRDLETALARAVSRPIVAEEVGVEFEDGCVVLPDDLEGSFRAADLFFQREILITFPRLCGFGP